MGRFAFTAVAANSEVVQGVEAAASEFAVRSALERRGFLVVRIRQENTGKRTSASRSQVLQFTRAIAPLLKSGVPLLQALGASEAIVSQRFGVVIQDVRSRVERGQTLTDGLGHHSDAFDALYTGMVRAGEASGNLAGVFEHLVVHLEREAQLRARLGAALLYPLLLACTGIVILLLVLVFVLPGFADIVEQSGSRLPWLSRTLIDGSNLLRSASLATYAAGIMLCVALAGWIHSSQGRTTAARVALRLPFIGPIRRSVLGARFARSAGVLLTGGAPLLKALRASENVTGDEIARAEILELIHALERGRTFGEAVNAGHLWPATLRQLITVGERSGTLGVFMLRAADLLDESIERSLNALIRLLEPAMIVTIGGVVGFIALALLQAVHSVNAGVLP